MKEEWRRVVCGADYEVSNAGNVRSMPRVDRRNRN
jgi:hypothetical protein